MKCLSGKIALITGANSGIGAATAKRFAQEGADLVIAARRMPALEEVAEECRSYGVKVLCVSADVGKEEDCKNLVKAAIDAFGRIDVLVNNAGIADKHRPVDRIETDWYLNVVDIDQHSVFYMMHEAIPYMKETGGSIVNVSSIGAIRSNSGISYTAAKTAVIGMSQNVAIEFAGKGIRVNVVCPGPTPTALNTPEQIATFDAEFAAQCNGHMALGDVPEATAEDQAAAILFFASDDSKAINGQVIAVDNGMTI